jgi:hypothetical protein
MGINAFARPSRLTNAISLQVYKYTSLQVYKYTSIQVYKFTSIQVYKSIGLSPAIFTHTCSGANKPLIVALYSGKGIFNGMRVPS